MNKQEEKEIRETIDSLLPMKHLDKFWSKEPKVLFETNKLQYFFPNSSYSVVENLNAIPRLFIYMALLLIIFTDAYLIALKNSLSLNPFVSVSFI